MKDLYLALGPLSFYIKKKSPRIQDTSIMSKIHHIFKNGFSTIEMVNYISMTL